MKKMNLTILIFIAAVVPRVFTYAERSETDAIRLHIECAAPSPECMELPMLNEPGAMIWVKAIPDMKIVKSDVKNAEFATVEYGETGRKQLQVRLFESGTKTLAELTKANIQRRMAIVVNDKVISAPMIQAPITEGSFVLSPGASKQDEDSFSQLGWLAEIAEKETANTEKVKLYKMLAYITLGLALILGSAVFAFRRKVE